MPDPDERHVRSRRGSFSPLIAGIVLSGSCQFAFRKVARRVYGMLFMSMIHGLFSRTGQPMPDAWHAGMADRARHWPADYRAECTFQHGRVCLRERAPSRYAPAAGFARTDHLALVLDGQIHNRDCLQSRLGMGAASDAELALAAYGKWGSEFASHLVGEFVLAVIDEAEPRVTIVRDALGVRPIFVAETGEFFAFASNVDVLLGLPFVDRSPDTAWLVDYLETINADHEATPYTGVRALPPGALLEIGRSAVRKKQYWHAPAEDDALDITADEAVAEYRRLFDQAVACRLPEQASVACELSGGLDSTSIATTAGAMLKQRGGRLITLSHVCPPGRRSGPRVVDEREQIAEVLAVLPEGIHHWLDQVPPSQIAILADNVARHCGPQCRDFSSAQPGVAEVMRAEDCRILLSGHGGDQCATSLGAGYEQWLAQNNDWKTLGKVATCKSRFLWRFAAGRRILRRRALAKQAAAARDQARIIQPALMSDEDLLQRRATYPYRPAWGTISERERAVIASPHVAKRTQDGAVGSGPDGYRHAYPMLDQRLVEFCLRLPGRLKRSPEQRRVLIRAAMQDRLPDSVRLRHDKSGAILPVAVSGFYDAIDDYKSLFTEHREDPFVTGLFDPDMLIDALRAHAADPGSHHVVRARHIRRAAQVCLWSEWLHGDGASR